MKRSLLVSAACGLALAAGAIAAAEGDTVTMEGNTDRMGGDYRRIEASPSVEACHSACAADKECDAYTYVKSAHHCWLKKGAPPATPNDDTVSGVKKRSVGGGSCATVDGVTCEPNTDRMGGDYRRIDGAPSVQFCQNQCAMDRKCAAYTYVKSAFHCWLKEGAPNATANGDAVSGLKLPGPATTTPSPSTSVAPPPPTTVGPPPGPAEPGSQPGRDATGDAAPGAGDLEGRWVFGPNGESWTLTRIDLNRYQAQESGFANASGFATVNGADFRLDFTFPGGSGYYLGKIGSDGRRIETTRYHDGARFTFVRP